MHFIPGEADQEEKESPENTVDDDPIHEVSTTPGLEESDENNDDATEGDDEAEEDSELEEQDAEDNEISTRLIEVADDGDSDIEACNQDEADSNCNETAGLDGKYLLNNTKKKLCYLFCN